MTERVLITGAAGQDGMILSAMLAREGIETVGLVKPGTDVQLLRRYTPNISVIEADLTDTDRLVELVVDIEPTQVYNLGGFTSPGESWHHSEEVWAVNVEPVIALLEGMSRLDRPARLFQASSASIYEGADRYPQNESFEPAPRSPYAESKAVAMGLVCEARTRDGLFACSGILYNHESPLRGENFVTRKVSLGVARIAAGLQDTLELGDIEVARDWGWAPDYVRAMRLMLAVETPSDYILSSGISHRLSFFIQRAFEAVGITDWRSHVVSSTDQRRPVDTNKLAGDSRKAYVELGWRHTVDFDEMARAMVRHDVALLEDASALWTDF